MTITALVCDNAHYFKNIPRFEENYCLYLSVEKPENGDILLCRKCVRLCQSTWRQIYEECNHQLTISIL